MNLRVYADLGVDEALDLFHQRREEGDAVHCTEGDCGCATCIQQSNVGNSQEAEDVLQVRLGMVERGHCGAVVVVAAGGDDKGGLLALDETDGASIGVVEGLAAARDDIDPYLEGGGNAEVMHGHANDDLVSSEDLGNCVVGGFEELLLLRREMLLRSLGGCDPGCIHNREQERIKIAGGYGDGRIGLLPRLYKRCREVARDGVLSDGAGVDMQEVRHGG